MVFVHPQAFIIAITSDFIPKLVYKYEVSPNGTLHGYIDNSLSYFKTSDYQEQSIPDQGSETVCRYVYEDKMWPQTFSSTT